MWSGSAPVSYTHLDVYKRQERTRTVTDEDGTETEESYTVAIPIADIAAVYGNRCV